MIEYVTDAIEAVNNGEDVPKVVHQDFKLQWVRTDAWRGYYEAKPKRGTNWKEIESSWVTGNWEDAPDGHSENEVKRELKELEREHGTVVVVFAPTSNVFSTGFQVFVQKG